MPVMPIFLLWGAAGLVGWINLWDRNLGPRVVSRVWLSSVGLVLLGFWLLGANAYAKDVAFIESEMVTTALWLAETTEETAVIGVHDIGAIGFFSGRKLVDLAGLVSPDVIPFVRDERRLGDYLDSQGVDYLVTFPGWYGELIARATPIFESQGEFAPAQGGETMVVYRWSP